MTNFLPCILSARARLIHEGFEPRFVYLPEGGIKLLQDEIGHVFSLEHSGAYIAGMAVIERSEMEESDYLVTCDPAPGH